MYIVTMLQERPHKTGIDYPTGNDSPIPPNVRQASNSPMIMLNSCHFRQLQEIDLTRITIC